MAAIIRHSTVVPDVQDAVPHMSTPVAEVDGVKLYAPKFSPEIVTVEPPVLAAFPGVYALATGAATKAPVHSLCRECLPCGQGHR